MSPRSGPVPGPDDYGPALRLAREGHLVEAITAVRASLRDTAPDDATAAAAANALARIARAAEVAERLDEAEEAIAVGLALRPSYPDLHCQHARLLLARGRRVEARKALDRALQLHPRYVAARVERALLDAREGRIGESLQQLRELARECPIEEGAFEQGLTRLKEADVGEAGVFLTRALKLADPVLEERLEQIRRRLEDGEPERAAQLIREAMSHGSGYPDLHYLLGSAELRMGRCDDALASLARALEIHPDFHAARLQLASALHALGQSAQAIEQLQLVLEAEPDHADARALLDRWTARSRPAAGGSRRA